MSRQVSHRRGTRGEDACPVGEVAVSVLLLLAFLAAFALAGTSDYESVRACEGAQASGEVAR